MNGPRWLIRSALFPALCAFVLVGPAFGAEAPPPDSPPQAVEQDEPEGSPIDDEAMSVLLRMADTLAQTQRFTVTIRASYDVVQDTGEKITFSERRAVTLNRPDGLRVEAQESDGKRSLVTFDGKAISVLNVDENVYGQIDRSGTIDDAVRYLVQDLRVRLPLALLLVSTLPDELEQRLQSLDYVERDMLTAVPTDHLAGRTEDVDFQIWIATEGPPLPQRVTITYKADEGEPQYRADFSEWNLNPDVQPVQLAFHPPDGAERIPVMVRVRRTAAGSSEGAPK
ncbi:DUF2092 domain-containing protein [Azospirillum formosense]|uniref:DUF2092 domain-containing protein n=1 Tax=Azospirillum formosense TaxID=861533 RepID=A0ABX2KRK5_9PROT|nr:DUF2092 domain-containing protein [Azospirillum formosense]MBY3755111.1 DUF2092 domain-containing protein [Azospirillum formosense]NUB17992.1 DUF2092 domain-containing protein [Azospirillum formosense]